MENILIALLIVASAFFLLYYYRISVKELIYHEECSGKCESCQYKNY